MSVLKSIFKNPTFPVVVLFIIFLIITSILSPGMLNGTFIKIFFASNFALICITVGTAIVIMGGGIDISLGALVALTNVILTQLVANGLGMIAAIVLALMVSTLCGALNGAIIGILRVPPMITTFASLSIFTGLSLWVMPLPGGIMPANFRSFFSADPGGIPVTFIFLVGIMLLTFLIQKSPLGIKIKAVGWNPEKAYISGIAVRKVQFFTYAFAGFVCGIGAVGLTANMGGGDPNIGVSFSMSALAACVIGGVALNGGVGNTLGAFIGAMFLSLLVNLVFATNISPYYQNLVSGLILFISMVGSVLISRKSTISQTSNI